jgi:hypothetical protein
VTVSAPSTVGELLQGSVDRAAVVAALPSLPGPVGDLLVERVVAAVDAMLDVDLAGVLLDGWATYGALAEAARRTRESASATETVPLHHQELTWASQPSVNVFVDGAQVATLAFDLTITADIAGVSAEVRAGRLVALRGGDVSVRAQLVLAGRTVAEREVPFALGVSVPLGDGFPLLPAAQPVGTSPRRRFRAVMIAAGAVLLAALVSIGAVTIGVSGTTPSEAEEPAGIGGAVHPGETWNVRRGPSGSAPVIATVQLGERVVVRCTTENGWLRLVSPHPDGYVSRNGLALDAVPPPC